MKASLYEKAQKLTVKDALNFLKNGNKLLAFGSNMDTLTYEPKLTVSQYRWQRINDQGPSWLSEAEVSSLLQSFYNNKYKFYII